MPAKRRFRNIHSNSLKVSEHSEQSAVFEWVGWHTNKWPELELIYAVPNAGKRSKIMGAMMKREGLRAGVPDICLPVARCGYNSLYIEMKVNGNDTKESQKKWIKKLKQFNNLAVVCYGKDEAINTLEAYLQDRIDKILVS